MANKPKKNGNSSEGTQRPPQQQSKQPEIQSELELLPRSPIWTPLIPSAFDA